MKLRLPWIIAIIVTLVLGGMAWLAYEAKTLEKRFASLDRKAQTERLLQISLETVNTALDRLLQPEIDRPFYEYHETYAPGLPEEKRLNNTRTSHPLAPSPLQTQTPSWIKGYFMITPDRKLNTPAQDKQILSWIKETPGLLSNMYNKAENPSAPVVIPGETPHRPTNSIGTISITEQFETDPYIPVVASLPHGSFFAWWYKNNLIFMRGIRTTHGYYTQGFIVEKQTLEKLLLPLVDKHLPKPALNAEHTLGAGNINRLPITLAPGPEIILPDMTARTRALNSAILSIYLIPGIAAVLVIGLLIFYSRLVRRRDDFVSTITHELRTPLTSITLYAEMLEHNMVPDSKKHEYYTSLYKESTRLSRLVENVLAFSKLTRGKLRGRQDCDTGENIFNQVVDKIRPRLEEAGFTVSLAIAPQARILPIRTDIISLEQILGNLADNAIKYGKGNEKPAIQITVQLLPRRVLIRFRDNGPGIAFETRRTLFTAFSRSAKANAGKQPGIGLGLTLSRDIAKSIGGDLSLESSSLTGACFILTIPA